MAAAKKQKGLGRGLDALLGSGPGEDKPLQDEPPVRGDARRLPIEFLIANPDQPRRVFQDDMIAELAASLKARGMIQPILVRPKGGDTYEIVAGERRWRAAQKAKLHEVPVIIRELTDVETAELALIENLQRVDLNPMEEARAYEALAKMYDRTQDQIATAVGKSRSHVANMMRLNKLPSDVQNSVSSAEISMGHARALLGATAPEKVLETVLRENLSVRDTERLVGEISPSKKTKRGGKSKTKDNAAAQKPSGPKDADTRALERDLATALGLEVEISHAKKGSGEVMIRYLNLDQLDDVCRRLMGAGV